MNKTNTIKTNTNSGYESTPRLISARQFAKEQGLDYGYILRAIKSLELPAEKHGGRFKLDRVKASAWLQSKVVVV
tara:strand:+ start:2154 stop:2378 length:225 start_codon:yes stop_codon:yes gene_type:complete